MTFVGRRRVLLNPTAPFSFTPADVPQAEADSLIALYRATRGKYWDDNTGWLSDTTVDNWFGITVTDGHVTAIDLRMNGLTPDCSTVDFSPFNDYLTFIRLAHNPSDTPDKLDGHLSQFSGFTAITTIDVGPSDFTGSFADLSSLTTLEALDLESCTMTGGTISDLPLAGLNTLDLGATTMPAGTHTIADLAAITDPTTYITLTIAQSNLLTGDLAALPAWPNLPSFRLQKQLPTVSGPTNIGGWTSIQSLLLDRNEFSTAELDQILADIYTARAAYTHSAPYLHIYGGAGDDEASGTYQYAANPSTGKEYIYALANDDDNEGFNTWSFRYTDGGETVTVP